MVTRLSCAVSVACAIPATIGGLLSGDALSTVCWVIAGVGWSAAVWTLTLVIVDPEGVT